VNSPATGDVGAPQPSQLGSLIGAEGDLPSALRRLAPAIVGYALPFGIVVTLALKNGGYDVGARSEIGIASWWIVLVGVVSGMLSARRIDRGGWVLAGLLAAFALWTGLAIGWSESAERSWIELARVLAYLGILALGLTLQGREGLRRTIGALAAAIGLVAVLALGSRLAPDLISSGEAPSRILGSTQARLSYGLNYWNGLAALMALGIPLMLTMALRARALVAQALSAAMVPVLALTAFFTLSRGGAIETGIGIAVFLILYPRRLAALPTIATTAIGSAALIAGAAQRDALSNGLGGASAHDQGNELLAMAIVVCAGVALLQVAFGLARRHAVGPRIAIPRASARWLTGGAALVAVVIAVAAGIPGELSDRWDEFKQPLAPTATGAARFESASGSGRYQAWQAAVDAYKAEPLTGIGPGTYEFWWARNGSIAGFLRDAHSLYLETLAETGLVGFLLIVALVVGVLAIGVRRVIRASEDKRALLAGAVASCAVFAFAAAIDWVWELAVLPAVFLLLAAAICGPKVVRRRVGGDAPARPRGGPAPLGRLRSTEARRAVVGGAAVVALVLIAIPYATASAVSASRDAALDANLPGALHDVAKAQDIQPYAATPNLQRALLLERDGDLDGAAAAAAAATDDEPTNWRTWLVRSRIEAERGEASAAVRAYERARSLNPRSPLFAPGVVQ
jgi:O-Antigen ligase